MRWTSELRFFSAVSDFFSRSSVSHAGLPAGAGGAALKSMAAKPGAAWASLQPGQGGMPNSEDPAAELGLPALNCTAATADYKVFSSCNPHSSVRYQYVFLRMAVSRDGPSGAVVLSTLVV